ncbi:uncharacterized protein [Branchiostoma lanceolatum]|uniref:uncharacterized protein n=1 Tax=Branchiostoma lanceolatum TaxID=7740 RepID=UPI003453DAEF
MAKICTRNIWRKLKLDRGPFAVVCGCMLFPCFCGLFLYFTPLAIGTTATALASSSLSFKNATCTTISSEYRGTVKCEGFHDRYPCLLVKVSYNQVLNDTATETEGFLYYDESEITGDKRCSVDLCGGDSDSGYWVELGRLTAFNKTYGKTNATYSCLYNPSNTSQVLARRTASRALIFLSFVWTSVVSLCIRTNIFENKLLLHMNDF